MKGERHQFLLIHGAPRLEGEITHVEPGGTDGLAEAATAAGIDKLVFGMGCAVDNPLIVENLTGVLFRVTTILLQIRANLDALKALTLYAATGFSLHFVVAEPDGNVCRHYSGERRNA